MKLLFKYFVSYVPWLLLLALLVWGQATVNLALPDYTSKIIDKGILLKDQQVIWGNGLAMLLLTVVGGMCAISVGFLASRIAAGYVRKLRGAVFEKVERFSLNEFDSFSPSSLVTRATNDMQQVQTVMSMVLRIALMAPFMGVGAVIKAYDIDPSMYWIVLIAIGMMVGLMIVLFIVVVPKFSQIQKLVDKLSQQAKEMLTGVRVIRAFNNDKIHLDKFEKTNRESTQLNIFVNRMVMLMQPAMTLIMSLAAMAVVWVGAYQISQHNLQIGDLVALIQYVSQAIMSFLMISMMFIMIPRAAVSLRRIKEILVVEPQIVDLDKPRKIHDDVTGTVAFNDVSFGYVNSEEPILSNVSFSAEPGQTTAIIGGTGSGKTTILKLIPRLYDITSGSITIDGIDVRDISQNDLHEMVGYVPQKASLFSGTIRSNVAYGRQNASDREIKHALRVAQAEEFVESLQDKWDSVIAQSGNNLSGGQKQRLSIARALVKKPKIYLFDDSFSALDFKTDMKLRQALQSEIKNSTFIVVAQRISTIMQAERIVVLDDGKVVDIGNHNELLGRCKVYREIAQSQLSPTELSKGIHPPKFSDDNDDVQAEKPFGQISEGK